MTAIISWPMIRHFCRVYTNMQLCKIITVVRSCGHQRCLFQAQQPRAAHPVIATAVASLGWLTIWPCSQPPTLPPALATLQPQRQQSKPMPRLRSDVNADSHQELEAIVELLAAMALGRALELRLNFVQALNKVQPAKHALQNREM